MDWRPARRWMEACPAYTATISRCTRSRRKSSLRAKKGSGNSFPATALCLVHSVTEAIVDSGLGLPLSKLFSGCATDLNAGGYCARNLHLPIPRRQRIIMIVLPRPRRSAIRANALVPASYLSYLAFGTLTKRATTWLRYTAPVFVFAILVAAWDEVSSRFNRGASPRSKQPGPRLAVLRSFT